MKTIIYYNYLNIRGFVSKIKHVFNGFFILGANHVWIGGDMSYIKLSSNDPIFYLLHSFVDQVLVCLMNLIKLSNLIYTI